MLRAFGLAVAVLIAGHVSPAAAADDQQCQAAALILKNVYADPQAPATAVLNAKDQSQSCLKTLSARVDDCRGRHPESEQKDCRELIARHEACTKLFDAYALAIKKRGRSMDLGSRATEDPREDFDRGKAYEEVCFTSAT